MFHRPGGEHRFELTSSTVTIGRGADCELLLADDRISSRHCRISAQGADWMIEDLRSTNRTFVNGDPLGDTPHRLRHGDMVPLGARDTQLFEARFVIDERADEYRAAARAVAEGLHRELAELRTQLAARGDEIARLGALTRRLQGQLPDAAAAARRASATMTAKIEDLRGHLATERTEHAACHDEVERTRRHCAQLEADLVTSRARAGATSTRASVPVPISSPGYAWRPPSSRRPGAALATATDNVRALQQAHDDALLRLQDLEPGTRTQ